MFGSMPVQEVDRIAIVAVVGLFRVIAVEASITGGKDVSTVWRNSIESMAAFPT